MKVNFRRLLKRPRHPRQWPPSTHPLIVFLSIAAIAVLLVAWVLRPKEFPPTHVTDQWAAESAAFAAGAFLLAVLATSIATVAYINSTERPLLTVIARYAGHADPLQIDWFKHHLAGRDEVVIEGEHRDWRLDLLLLNRGPVAARYVAVRVYFGPGISLVDLSFERTWQPVVADSSHVRSDTRLGVTAIQWEGGADVMVHPRWLYVLPLIGPGGLFLSAPVSQEDFTFDVDVVADDVTWFRQGFTIKLARPA